MHLGIGCDFNVEVIAGFLSDEGHQLAGKAELAELAVAAGQVTAQGHDAAQSGVLELLQLLTHPRRARADA